MLSNFRHCSALGAPISFNLCIDDLQIEVAITNKIVRLDVSMHNVVFVEICVEKDRVFKTLRVLVKGIGG